MFVASRPFPKMKESLRRDVRYHSGQMRIPTLGDLRELLNEEEDATEADVVELPQADPSQKER